MRWLVLVLWVWGIFVVAGFAKADPSATAAEPGKSFRDCPDCPEMVVLPPGRFMMGTESAESKREGVAYGNAKWERPRHSVTVGAAFAIGKYHVTRVEYDRFLQATSRADARCPGWQPPDFVQTDRDPVVCVSWDDAQAYVAWLSLTTGKAYRLPTEAEWEYAARAVTTQNFTPVITGTAGQNLATINQPLHGFAAGSLAYFATAIAASGQVIQGPYLVNTVIDQNNYQILLPTPMDGTNSVALPIFATTSGSQNLQITLPNHGLATGNSFYCNVPVAVGGLTISGQLFVNGVIDQNNFTTYIGQGVSATASATMNGGQAQVATQAPTARWWGDPVGVGNANCGNCGSQWDNRRTSPVGSFRPNLFGLYDMLGNAFQWVEDCDSDSYADAPSDSSVAQVSGRCDRREVRGGSYEMDSRFVRSGNRFGLGPGDRNDGVGFRVARTL